MPKSWSWTVLWRPNDFLELTSKKKDVLFHHFLIGLFVFLISSCMNHLYSLKINPLSVVSFTIIFSHSEMCLFILFIISFAMQNLLNFIRFHLFIIVFTSITLGSWSKRILVQFMSKSILLMFSSKSLKVSDLTFKYQITCFYLTICLPRYWRPFSVEWNRKLYFKSKWKFWNKVYKCACVLSHFSHV